MPPAPPSPLGLNPRVTPASLGPQPHLARLGLGKAKQFLPGQAMGRGTTCKSICNVALSQVSPRSQPGMAAAQRHQGTNKAGSSGRLLSPPPCPQTLPGTHVQCNYQTLGLQGRGLGGGLSVCDTHLHRRQPSMPGCQWRHQRSCRCRPLRCPSSPPPRCTGARCKAPWSAHAWLGKQRHEQRFPGGPAVARPALQTLDQGQDGHAGWKGWGW